MKEICDSLDEYFKKLTANKKPKYYVKDSAHGKETDIRCLFILESPHVDEIESKKPLMGSSGQHISSFFNLGDKPFGNYEKLSEKHIAIINVSNIPLKLIEGQNEDDARSIKKELENHRVNKEINQSLLKFFINKLKKYTKVETYVICGGFAEKYFDQFVKSKGGKRCLDAFYDSKIDILKVPHPSYGHWQFIDKHKDNLNRLQEIFSML